MAFTVTIHEWIGNVRFPAFRLGFGTTGSRLKLAQGGRFRRCSETVCFRGTCRPTEQGDLTPAVDPLQTSPTPRRCDATIALVLGSAI